MKNLQGELEQVLVPLSSDWVSLESVAIAIMRHAGKEITKRSIAKVARLLGMPVKHKPIVLRSTGKRGPRQRTKFVLCVHREDFGHLVADIEDRIRSNATLYDSKQKNPDPTPAQIRRMCEQIRANRRRRGSDDIAEGDHKPVETPQLHVQFKRGKVWNIG